MKLFRVGTCLAFLTAAAACSQAPQSISTPTAVVGGSTADAADGSTLKVKAPSLVSPANGERAEDRRPTLLWLNSVGNYGSTGLEYEIELSSPTTVVYRTIAGESADISSHLIPIELDYDVVYSWRARARHVTEVGPWSNWASFMSPTRPVVVAPPPVTTTVGGSSTCAAPLSPLAPGELRKPKPNASGIVNQVASAFPGSLRNSCQDHGGSWDFMDRVVDALRSTDGRWGYNCKRGNCGDASHDVVSYYYRGEYPDIQGRFEVYIFDIIAGHCGATPSTVWLDVTDVTANNNTVGRTVYPRPGGPTRTPTCAS
jgi:hypothetical protein